MKIFNSIFILLFFILLSNLVTADIADDLRNINPSSAIEYYEINDIKQDALIMLFTIDRKNPPIELINFVTETRDFINEFEKIYVDGKNANLSSMEEIVKRSYKLKEKIPKNPKTFEEIDIVENANRVIEKFLYNKGILFENMANKENKTRLKILYLRNASYAYNLADEFAKSTSLKILANELEEKYNEDIKKANQFFNEGMNEKKESKINENISVENLSMSEKINAIVHFNYGREKFKNALILYKYHYEDEMEQKCEYEISEIEKYLPKLQNDVISFFFILIFGIAIIFGYLFISLNEWKKAMYDEQLGDEIMTR